MFTAISAIASLIIAVVLGIPSWEIFGLPKRVWVPFVYIIMFVHIIALAFYWLCPMYNGLLGGFTNTRYCSKCGLDFYE